ncbi:MAG: single-stranded-DNA-specific exonuclease RecJ [Planctomycetes bacterium]|nr:single-stranded-DNA-specific exonuclease RecJ [Planctomycetota bacterium]
MTPTERPSLAHLLTRAPADAQRRRWHLHSARPELAGSLSATLGVSPLLGQLLLNRGFSDPDSARPFLRPDLNKILDPATLPGIDRAVERITRALRDGEKIVIFGDYDVDGVSATTLLVSLFRFLHRPVEFYIPDRMSEGYSLSRQAIEKFARDGVKVLITVDCGTTDVDEVTFAQEKGIDVVVTDHHEPGPALPPACALVNPKLPGSQYPFLLLAGTGVAFKLVWAILQGLSASRKVSPSFREFLVDSMALVALGTLADVVPLVGENRILAAFGLTAVAKTRNPGLRALLRVSGVADGAPVTAEDVAFRVAPRINAGGRVGHASLGVDLLLSSDPFEIEKMAERLDKANRERQRIEAEILQAARAQVTRELQPADSRSLVVAGEGWHPGVVGIVAAKIAEEFYRPTLVVSLRNGAGRGSGRSIPGFDLHKAVTACSEVFHGFGGHAHAVGFELEAGRIPALREQLEAYARRALPPEDLVPRLTLDAEVNLADLTSSRVRELSLLAPCGNGNPSPVLCASDLRVSGEPRIIGKKQDHLSFHVTQGKVTRKAVAFGMADRIQEVNSARGRPCALAFTPELNSWRGEESVEVFVKDIRF